MEKFTRGWVGYLRNHARAQAAREELVPHGSEITPLAKSQDTKNEEPIRYGSEATPPAKSQAAKDEEGAGHGSEAACLVELKDTKNEEPVRHGSETTPLEKSQDAKDEHAIGQQQRSAQLLGRRCGKRRKGRKESGTRYPEVISHQDDSGGFNGLVKAEPNHDKGGNSEVCKEDLPKLLHHHPSKKHWRHQFSKALQEASSGPRHPLRCLDNYTAFVDGKSNEAGSCNTGNLKPPELAFNRIIFQGNALSENPRLHSFENRLILDHFGQVGRDPDNSPTKWNWQHYRDLKVCVGVYLFIHTIPIASAAFTAWDALRISTGVTSFGTGLAVIPLRTVEGVGEVAWISNYVLWGLSYVAYLGLQTALIPHHVRYRRKLYIFFVSLATVHFTIAMSQGFSGIGSGFAMHGPLVAIVCAYLISLPFNLNRGDEEGGDTQLEMDRARDTALGSVV